MENLIFEHRKRVAENIEKSFENNIEKARQVGDISSDGKKCGLNTLRENLIGE